MLVTIDRDERYPDYCISMDAVHGSVTADIPDDLAARHEAALRQYEAVQAELEAIYHEALSLKFGKQADA